MPRFGGIATFMRLPGTSEPADLDVAVVGVPFDLGTSYRPGARFGPRGIRAESEGSSLNAWIAAKLRQVEQADS